VTIRTHNLPSNVLFQARIGHYRNGAYNWVNLPDIDTENGGALTFTFDIPDEFADANQLVLRLTQVKKNGRSFTQDQAFINRAGGGTGGYPGPIYNPPYYYYGIPTIWIVSVRRNESVTIRTHNFPPGVTFDVLMGWMGTRGVRGIKVGELNSGDGGTLVATFSIPAELYGARQISIRTQNRPTGYFSYNWFWNNNAY
jgi:hypothetical protein